MVSDIFTLRLLVFMVQLIDLLAKLRFEGFKLVYQVSVLTL